MLSDLDAWVEEHPKLYLAMMLTLVLVLYAWSLPPI